MYVCVRVRVCRLEMAERSPAGPVFSTMIIVYGHLLYMQVLPSLSGLRAHKNVDHSIEIVEE